MAEPRFRSAASAVLEVGLTVLADDAAIIAAMQATRNFPGAAIGSISFSPDNHDALTTAELAIYEMQLTPAGLGLVPRQSGN